MTEIPSNLPILPIRPTGPADQEILQAQAVEGFSPTTVRPTDPKKLRDRKGIDSFTPTGDPNDSKLDTQDSTYISTVTPTESAAAQSQLGFFELFVAPDSQQAEDLALITGDVAAQLKSPKLKKDTESPEGLPENPELTEGGKDALRSPVSAQPKPSLVTPQQITQYQVMATYNSTKPDFVQTIGFGEGSEELISTYYLTQNPSAYNNAVKEPRNLLFDVVAPVLLAETAERASKNNKPFSYDITYNVENPKTGQLTKETETWYFTAA